MNQTELLTEWLVREIYTLKNIQEDIQSIEKLMEQDEQDKELNDLRVSYLEKWIHEEYLTGKLKDNLSNLSKTFNETYEEEQENLERLKTEEKSLKFVINKIKRELNIEQ